MIFESDAGLPPHVASGCLPIFVERAFVSDFYTGGPIFVERPSDSFSLSFVGVVVGAMCDADSQRFVRRQFEMVNL